MRGVPCAVRRAPCAVRGEREALLGPRPPPPGAQKPTPPAGEAHFKKKNERHRSEKHFSAQDRPKELFIQIVDFLIEHVNFSLEKCMFGANRGVLAYVLKR